MLYSSSSYTSVIFKEEFSREIKLSLKAFVQKLPIKKYLIRGDIQSKSGTIMNFGYLLQRHYSKYSKYISHTHCLTSLVTEVQ